MHSNLRMVQSLRSERQHPELSATLTNPQYALGLMEALAAATYGAAYSCFAESSRQRSGAPLGWIRVPLGGPRRGSDGWDSSTARGEAESGVRRGRRTYAGRARCTVRLGGGVQCISYLPHVNTHHTLKMGIKVHNNSVSKHEEPTASELLIQALGTQARYLDELGWTTS